MDELPKNPEVKGKTVRQLKETFVKRLKINNLYEMAKDKEAFKFKKIKGGYKITANVEKRGPIYGTLEFVASFDHEVDILLQ
jgi:hypothetical protein